MQALNFITYADILRPVNKGLARTYDLLLVVGGSLLMALSAQVAFRLPVSPVPITGQTMGVLLVGALLGSRRGALSMLLYLMEGVVGLPVFAGGAAGLPYFLGPTGGYLIGFVMAAFVVGFLSERGWDRRIGTTLCAMVLGTATIYISGLAWLGIYTGVENLLAVGLYPFLPGAGIKIVAAALLLPQGWKVLDRHHH